MIDTSDVTRFASKLASSPNPLTEEQWQDEWSNKVADEMRTLTPVNTGALRASIQPTGDGVTVGVPYAAYVEYGTSDTAPQPYAGPAVNRLARPAADDLGKRTVRGLIL
jgi:HK97 gp10 family phage protein